MDGDPWEPFGTTASEYSCNILRRNRTAAAAVRSPTGAAAGQYPALAAVVVAADFVIAAAEAFAVATVVQQLAGTVLVAPAGQAEGSPPELVQ